MGFIPLGVIGRPFGIRGEVRLKPHNRTTTWFDRAEGIWVRSGEEETPRFLRSLGCRWHKDFLLLSLAGIRNRDHAEELRGLEVVAPEEELEPLEEGEFYWYRLIGLRVQTRQGKVIGEVVRMEETAPKLGGTDLFVVSGESGEILIPALEGLIEEIDLGSGTIVVNEERMEEGA